MKIGMDESAGDNVLKKLSPDTSATHENQRNALHLSCFLRIKNGEIWNWEFLEVLGLRL